MKRTLLFASILFFALASAEIARAADPSQNSCMECASAHLKQLAREANTEEQYSTLAACYQKLHNDYLEQAAQEKQEWERRSQNVMATAAKYPRPVDSARNLYEYDLSKASEAEELSTKFSRLAALHSSSNSHQIPTGLNLSM